MSLVLGPNKDILAAASTFGLDTSARLWTSAGRQWLGDWIPHAQVIRLSPTGRFLATAYQLTVRVWDTNTRHKLKQISYDWAIWALAFSPDESTFAIGTSGGFIHLWSTSTWRVVHEWFTTDESTIGTVALRKDGKYFATGDTEMGLRLWNPA